MYHEVLNAQDIKRLVKVIEESGVDVLDKEQLLNQGMKIRNWKGKGSMKDIQRQSRQAVAANQGPNDEIEFHYGVIDDLPFIYTDNIRLGSTPASKLKKAGFKEGLSFWYMPVTRRTLLSLAQQIQEEYQDVRIAEWTQFKERSKIIFNIDLGKYDSIGDET